MPERACGIGVHLGRRKEPARESWTNCAGLGHSCKRKGKEGYLSHPAIIIPPATPHESADVYILGTSQQTSDLCECEYTYDMTVPRSCKKKTNAINYRPHY